LSVTARIAFESIGVRHFRNIDALELEPAPGLNVIVGDNGQGKTSLLEALYFVATSKSFRTTAMKDLIQEGRDIASVRARIAEGGLRREQRATLGLRARSVLIDGKRPERLYSYALRTPTVVFHPGDLELVNGPGAPRRLLLARLSLFVVPQSADDRQRYQRALRERQRTLEERGERATDLEAYETLLVKHGVALALAQQSAAERLIEALAPAFAQVAPEGLALEAHYRPGGCTDPAQFHRELEQRRTRDRHRKLTTFGPHRDDLDFVVDGRSARRHASQGQQRMLTLALKLAELECVRSARNAHPVLLLDDVASEFDPSRSSAAYALVAHAQSQVFVTTPRRDWLGSVETSSERAEWIARAGRFERA
jgi:DNA replication and repair protein RecF